MKARLSFQFYFPANVIWMDGNFLLSQKQSKEWKRRKTFETESEKEKKSFPEDFLLNIYVENVKSYF